MNKYEVRFIYQFVTIETIAIADDEEQADRFASLNLLNAGIMLGEKPLEIVITKKGEHK
jgi:hypothetical protein